MGGEGEVEGGGWRSHDIYFLYLLGQLPETVEIGLWGLQGGSGSL